MYEKRRESDDSTLTAKLVLRQIQTLQQKRLGIYDFGTWSVKKRDGFLRIFTLAFLLAPTGPTF